MSRYKVFKLHFLTPLHIGLGRSTYDFSSSELHSDTITAALASIKAQQGASSEEIADMLRKVVVSSAFPYVGDMLFLPKPLFVDQINIEGKDVAEYRKAVKSVQYIESSVWTGLLSGQPVHITESQLKDKYIIPKGRNEFINPIRKQVACRASVSRSGEDNTEPFYFEWLYFDSSCDCGLYFIADAESTVMQEIESLLVTLGETGIGTDRTVGGGQFEVKCSEINFPDADSNSTGWLSLSLYLPSLSEQKSFDLSKSCYNLICRGGYMSGSTNENLRHLWKKSIYMYQEGSVFYTEECPVGNIVDLRPNWNGQEMHPVYRSGKALFIPVMQ